MTHRAVLYARQSIEKAGGHHSLSLDSQIAELETRCQREGWRVVETIREPGLKGHMDADERPGLARAIALAETGQIDILLVWDLSRLARALWLQEPLMRQLDRAGVRVVSHTEPHADHTLMRQITGAFNEDRTRDLSRRVTSAVLTLQQRGVHHGVVPWGYRRPEKGKPLVIDEAIAPIVRGMYESRAAGIGPAAIARDLNARGVRTAKGHLWPTPTIVNTLSHVAYRGAVRAGEAITEDAHPAIIDAATWHAAQVRTLTRGPRQKRVSSWLEGLIEHACGNRMYLHAAHGAVQASLVCRSARAGWTYAGCPPCPVSPRSLVLHRAEPLAWGALGDLLARLPEPAHILDRLHAQYRAATPGIPERIAAATARKERAERQRDRAIDLYLRGDIDRARYDAAHARALAELADAEIALATLPQPPDERAITETWRHLSALHELMPTWPEPDRAAVLREVGTAIVGPAGVKLPGKGGADAGCVTIRPHDALRPYLFCSV